MSKKAPWYREFDLAYWQMREALGYPIPDRIDRRFPRKLAGNCGLNPFMCGKCEARRRYPEANGAAEAVAARREALDQVADFFMTDAGSSNGPGSWADIADAVRNDCFQHPPTSEPQP